VEKDDKKRDKGFGHCRWCEACGHHHGLLYKCEHYPQEVLDDIERHSQRITVNNYDNTGAMDFDRLEHEDPHYYAIMAAMFGMDVIERTRAKFKKEQGNAT